MPSSSWRDKLAPGRAATHVVQFYRHPPALAEVVAAWLAPALRSGGGAVLVATPAHASAVAARLRDEFDLSDLQAKGRLVVVDADQTLARFTEGDEVDAKVFRSILHDTLARVRRATGGREIRAWGEMVELLRQRGRTLALQRLEAAWNDLLADEDVKLLCSYRVDHLAPDVHEHLLGDLYSCHSDVVLEEGDEALDAAAGRALVETVGQERATTLRAVAAERHPLPSYAPAGHALLLALYRDDRDLGKSLLATTAAHLRGGR